MKNMILIDLETQSFNVESGIYEVAALVVENYEVIDHLYLGIIENNELVDRGYGIGYLDISNDSEQINKFKNFIGKYEYPLVAHNGTFDRKFLLYYNWIDSEYPFYDSIRAIKYKNPRLFSYSISHLKDFVGIEDTQTHMAIDDVKMLYKILLEFRPDRWIPIGTRISPSNSQNKNLSSITQDFEVIKNLFAGKNIVFTGKGPYTRNELMQLSKRCGADITSNNITKKTTMLIVGDDAGSKLEKAKVLGIEIMGMEDFYSLIEGIDIDSNQKNIIEEISKKEVALSTKLEGQNITLFPMKQSLAQKASKLVDAHGGKSLFGLRQKETTLLVYQPYAEDLVTVQRARDNGIETMTLGEFNKYILSL